MINFIDREKKKKSNFDNVWLRLKPVRRSYYLEFVVKVAYSNYVHWDLYWEKYTNHLCGFQLLNSFPLVWTTHLS